ncbi:MAG: hypothetical protein JKY37_25810 [Nannocystaceae bacterium]|nr:hypothetical protein [Nannocystaceae bacterium]
MEIVRGADLLSGVENWDNDPAKLIEATAAHKRSMTQALSWLTTAIEESERRGLRPPPETYYYRAYALTTLGEVSQAGEAIALAEQRHDVAAHRIDRMAALVHLLRGEPHLALRLAHRAVVNAPATGDRLISRFIYALILDRAGALHSAVLEFRSLHREGGRHNARIAVESVLPVHERLFLRALDHQTAELRPHADRLWALYLSSEAPEAPERVLARRHRAELEPRPETIDPKR